MDKEQKFSIKDFLKKSPVAQAFILVAIINICLLCFNPLQKLDPQAIQANRTWAWWAVKDYRENPADVIMMGSSFIMNPTWQEEAVYRNQSVDLVIDHRTTYLEDAIKSRASLNSPQNLRCFNFGLPGAMVSDQFMIIETMCKGQHKPKMAIFCVAPRDLMDCRFFNAGGSKHFRYLTNFTENKQAKELAFMDIPGKFADGFSTSLFFKTKASEIQVLRANLLKSWMQPYLASLPESPLNQKTEEDRRSVFKRDEIEKGAWLAHPNTPYWYVDSSPDCRMRYKHLNSQVFENQKKWLDMALKTCQAEGIKPVVVNVPSSPEARDCMYPGIYDRHIEAVTAITSANKVPFYNLDPGWKHEKKDYTDWGHMGPQGGRKMLNAIAGVIAGNADLVAAINSNTKQTGDNRQVAGSSEVKENAL